MLATFFFLGIHSLHPIIFFTRRRTARTRRRTTRTRRRTTRTRRRTARTSSWAFWSHQTVITTTWRRTTRTTLFATLESLKDHVQL
jgi:hypothetical protein